MPKALSVNCPHCKKSVKWVEASNFRPFCSERCQQIDLGAWADGSYAIPTEPDEEWSGTNSLISSGNETDLLQ